MNIYISVQMKEPIMITEYPHSSIRGLKARLVGNGRVDNTKNMANASLVVSSEIFE